MHFYKSLYTERYKWNRLDELSSDSLDENGKNWMEKRFEGCEVFEEVKYLNADKASDHDGLSMALFQTCWEVVKEDVMNVFHNFYGRVNLLEAY